MFAMSVSSDKLSRENSETSFEQLRSRAVRWNPVRASESYNHSFSMFKVGIKIENFKLITELSSLSAFFDKQIVVIYIYVGFDSFT